jgi:hypothetical protein
MAYQNPDRYLSKDRAAAPRVIPRLIGEKTLAPLAGAPALPHLTPLAFDTVLGKWIPFANANVNGGNKVIGFLLADFYDQTVTTDAVNDTLVSVMLAGEIHVDDIPTPVGETTNNLKTSLRLYTRPVDLTIRGLDAVH